MSQAAASISPEGADYLRKLIARHPLGRQAEPDEAEAMRLIEEHGFCCFSTAG